MKKTSLLATSAAIILYSVGAKAQLPKSDPQLVTVHSEQERMNWRPEFQNLADFTATIGLTKPMTTLEVGDFYFGWRLDKNPKKETVFVWCDYPKKVSDQSWGFTISLYFIDGSGKHLQQVDERSDGSVQLRMFHVVFHDSPVSYSWNDQEITGCTRVLPAPPQGATDLLCVMGGGREGVRSRGTLVIPISKLGITPSPSH